MRDIGSTLPKTWAEEAFGAAACYAQSLPFAAGRLDDVSARGAILVALPSLVRHR